MITSAEYLGVFRAHWGKLLIALLLGAGLGIVAGQFLPVQYTADRLLVVRAQGGTGFGDVSQGTTMAADHAKSLAYLGSQPAMVQGVLDSMSLAPEDRAAVTAAVDVPSDTSYLSVRATASSDKAAVETAGALAKALEKAGPTIAPSLGEDSKVSLAINDVTPTTEQFSSQRVGLPKWMPVATLAAVLPVALFMLLFLRAALRRTVGESMDLDVVLPFPVLGTVTQRGHNRVETVRPTEDHHNVLVRSGLLGRSDQGQGCTVALTKVEGQPDPRLAIGLGQALGDLRRSVVVVDADLAAPTIPSPHGDGSPAGLAAMLRGKTEPVGLRPWLDSGADILPTTPEVASTRMLRSSHASEAFHTLRDLRSVVLLSTAPALKGPDASAVADFADEVILFATPRTAVEDVIRAARMFDSGAVTGLVLIAERGRYTGRAKKVSA